MLGHALLTEITTQYNSNTLTPENADLRTSYLINVISWEALYRSLNFIHTRIDSLGVVQNKATTTDSTDLDSLRNISEDIKNRALDYYNICKDFLECNRNLYPLYGCSNRDEHTSQIYFPKRDLRLNI